jgi:hypothetical protein
MFRSLNLNREKISISIKNFFELRGNPCEVSNYVEKGETRRRFNINGENSLPFLDFHFLKNGSTTIDITSGGVSDLRLELANFVKSDPQCALGDVDSKNKWFVAKEIQLEDFNGIIELLSESEYCKSHHDEVKEYSLVHKFEGNYNESLIIHYYYTSKKVLIQGRPLILFNEAVAYITELIELDDLPSTFNDYCKVNIKKSDIEEQYEHYFPYSHDKHSIKIKKVLHQAIYNLQIEGEMFDFSFLVFPAFKALEGHLKFTLHAFNINLEKNKFKMFKYNDTRKKYNLDTTYHANIACPNKIRYLENAYNFYNGQRHSLFHWSDPSFSIDDTRIIENSGEIKGLIIDTFSIIDEYYKL